MATNNGNGKPTNGKPPNKSKKTPANKAKTQTNIRRSTKKFSTIIYAVDVFPNNAFDYVAAQKALIKKASFHPGYSQILQYVSVNDLSQMLIEKLMQKQLKKKSKQAFSPKRGSVSKYFTMIIDSVITYYLNLGKNREIKKMLSIFPVDNYQFIAAKENDDYDNTIDYVLEVLAIEWGSEDPKLLTVKQLILNGVTPSFVYCLEAQAIKAILTATTTADEFHLPPLLLSNDNSEFCMGIIERLEEELTTEVIEAKYSDLILFVRYLVMKDNKVPVHPETEKTYLAMIDLIIAGKELPDQYL